MPPNQLPNTNATPTPPPEQPLVPQPPQAPSPPVQPAPTPPSKVIYEQKPDLSMEPAWLDLVFRIGFASIFLVNALVAWVEPEDFITLLESNFIGQHLGFADLLVKITALNDLALGTMIIVGKLRKYVYIWAALWLLLVAFLKLSNMVL